MWQRLLFLSWVCPVLMGCTTSQDVYIDADITAVIPPDRAVAFLMRTVQIEHSGVECRIFDDGIAFPSRPGIPNWGIVPFQKIRARAVWAHWPIAGTALAVGSGLAVVAEGQVGLIHIRSPEWEDLGDRCIIHSHPDPGPEGTIPPPDPGMKMAIEALVSLGASYERASKTDNGSARIYLVVGQ